MGAETGKLGHLKRVLIANSCLNPLTRHTLNQSSNNSSTQEPSEIEEKKNCCSSFGVIEKIDSLCTSRSHISVHITQYLETTAHESQIEDTE